MLDRHAAVCYILVDMDKNARLLMEYDFYGAFLTKRQQQAVEMYHGENYSLSEIGEEFGISRQGVHDALKSAEIQLDEYESKLGLVKRFDKAKEGIRKIDRMIDELVSENEDNEDLTARLEDIKTIIDSLDE